MRYNFVLPAIYLSHGSPELAVSHDKTTAYWQSLPELCDQAIKGVICISAHWDTASTQITGARPNKQLLCDFTGFEDRLYKQQWPSCDSTEAVSIVAEHLATKGHAIEINMQRPLDHGSWVPLRHAWPTATLPIVQISICSQLTPQWHIDLGKKLQGLRSNGFVIIGSGGLAHNLRRLQRQYQGVEASTEAQQYMQDLQSRIDKNDLNALTQWQNIKNSHLFIPSLEHYLPMLLVMGLALENEHAKWLHTCWSMCELDLHSFAFGA
jgi:4,5-DOPA dioxygenase extradiol